LYKNSLESIIYRLRGRHFKGKGRLLLALSPRSGMRTVRLPGEKVIGLDLSDELQRLMYADILHHDWLPGFAVLLQPGSTFLDIGANIGYFTIYAANRVGPSGTLIAVEPIPRTRERLRENLALNHLNSVIVDERALSDVEGAITLHVPAESAKRDYLVTCVPVPGWSPVSIPCTTLDSAFEAWGVDRVDLMKIDVEGAEPRVFRGGENVLRSGVIRAIICEFSGFHLKHSGLTCDEAAANIERLGFQHARLCGNGAIVMSQATPHMDDGSDHNMLFIHKDAVNSIAERSESVIHR
jgi:FkbM family methyltransferase